MPNSFSLFFFKIPVVALQDKKHLNDSFSFYCSVVEAETITWKKKKNKLI